MKENNNNGYIEIEIRGNKKSISFVAGLLQSNFLLLEYSDYLGLDGMTEIMKEVNILGKIIENQLEGVKDESK